MNHAVLAAENLPWPGVGDSLDVTGDDDEEEESVLVDLLEKLDWNCGSGDDDSTPVVHLVGSAGASLRLNSSNTKGAERSSWVDVIS